MGGGGAARISSVAFSGILAADRKVSNYWFGSFGADWTITSKMWHALWSWGKEGKPWGAGDKRCFYLDNDCLPAERLK